MTEHIDIAGYCRISVDEELDRDNVSIETKSDHHRLCQTSLSGQYIDILRGSRSLRLYI